MVAPPNPSKTASNKLLALSELDELEAPNHSFIGHRDILTRSLARYHFVAPYSQGIVLDVGCGRGYGFQLIQQHSAQQFGLDVSINFLREARAREPARAVVLGSGEKLPFLDGAFNSIIAFEVIEHIQDDLAFLHDLRRLACNDAFIAISTPNRLISSGNVTKPLNPFHMREYVAEEFYALLSQVFSSVIIYAQQDPVPRAISTNSLIDRIPIRWKYLIPTHVQGVLSVALRPALKLEDCRFETTNLETAHTFVALCRV